jgi:hypothetical protein
MAEMVNHLNTHGEYRGYQRSPRTARQLESRPRMVGHQRVVRKVVLEGNRTWVLSGVGTGAGFASPRWVFSHRIEIKGSVFTLKEVRSEEIQER